VAQFSMHDAKTNLSKLIASALDGDEVVIARGNGALVRLVPIKGVGARQFGAFSGVISLDDRFHELMSADELQAWLTD
jgi:antitoxin (DNA-binding transcriptional repressor) of toxin-antitoxin stability system